MRLVVPYLNSPIIRSQKYKKKEKKDGGEKEKKNTMAGKARQEQNREVATTYNNRRRYEEILRHHTGVEVCAVMWPTIQTRGHCPSPTCSARRTFIHSYVLSFRFPFSEPPLSLPVGFVFLFLLYFSSLCLLEKGGGNPNEEGWFSYSGWIIVGE